MATITIIHESMLGERYTSAFDLLEESLSLREFIRRRVYQEAAERALNGPRAGGSRPLRWEEHYERAIQAFARRNYIVLVDDRQITDLDAPLRLGAGSEVTFLRLVPLVGG